MYAYQLKMAMQRVAIALRRSNALAIHRLDRHAKSMNFPLVGGVQGAAAERARATCEALPPRGGRLKERRRRGRLLLATG